MEILTTLQVSVIIYVLVKDFKLLISFFFVASL